jgi:hypothetical protein
MKTAKALRVHDPARAAAASGSNHRMTSRRRFVAINGVAITPDFTFKP